MTPTARSTPSWSWTTWSRSSGPPAASAWSGSTCPKTRGPPTETPSRGGSAFDYGTFFTKGQHDGHRSGPVKRYNRQLRDLIIRGRARPSFLVSHELPLEEAPDGYERFDNREDGWTKVLLKPGVQGSLTAHRGARALAERTPFPVLGVSARGVPGLMREITAGGGLVPSPFGVNLHSERAGALVRRGARTDAGGTP